MGMKVCSGVTIEENGATKEARGSSLFMNTSAPVTCRLGNRVRFKRWRQPYDYHGPRFHSDFSVLKVVVQFS